MANSKSDFLERFKGRTMQMDKEGHLGVVMKTNIASNAFNKDKEKLYGIGNNQTTLKERVQTDK